jgi:hypothetical protein
MTYTFDKVTSGDVGEWNGDEQKAADYLNDLNGILAQMANEKFPDPTTEQAEAIKDLAYRFFFEDLCNNPEMLDHTSADKKFYVFGRVNEIE